MILKEAVHSTLLLSLVSNQFSLMTAFKIGLVKSLINFTVVLGTFVEYHVNMCFSPQRTVVTLFC